MSTELSKNERLIRSTPITLVFNIIILILIFDAFYLFVTIIEEFFVDLKDIIYGVVSLSAVIHVLLLLFQVLAILVISIKWFTSYYRIGDNYITKRTGIIFKRDQVINFNNLKLVDYRQGVLAQIFNYGDIIFRFTGQGEKFVVKDVESPKEIIKKIEAARTYVSVGNK